MIEGNLIVADLKDCEVFTCLKLNLNQVFQIVLEILLFTLPIAFILCILSYILVNKTAHDLAGLLLSVQSHQCLWTYFYLILMYFVFFNISMTLKLIQRDSFFFICFPCVSQP